MTETQSTRTGRKTRCHPGKHPGMLYIVTRDRGGRDDVRRKSPIGGVNICLYQILFSFSTDKDRRTDSRIRRKNTVGESRKFTRSSRCGFVAQWLERATRIRKTLGSIPGGAALCFFVWSGCQFFYLCRCWKRREFDKNDPDKSEFTICLYALFAPLSWHAVQAGSLIICLAASFAPAMARFFGESAP